MMQLKTYLVLSFFLNRIDIKFKGNIFAHVNVKNVNA